MGRIILLSAGVVTLGCWVSLIGYVLGTNRWGAFAVAPALLPLFVASAVIAVLGAAMWAHGVRHGRRDLPLFLVAAAHGAIVFYASTH